MRIGEFRKESSGPCVRVSATVEWEDCGRPKETLSFALEDVDPGEVAASPEAFTIRGALAALHWNESRVLVEGPLCPRLRDGLRAAMRLLRAWYSPGVPEPALEATDGFRPRRPAPPRAALFLSAGVDSLFILRSNRTSYSSEHPASFRVALFIPNFGVRLEAAASPRAVDLLGRQRRALVQVARIAGLRLIAASASSGALGEDDEFFRKCSHGCQLAAVGHLFPGLSSASIAASYSARRLASWGSHPLLEPNCSSSSLAVRHEGAGLTRLERVRSLAGWKEVLPHLIVCTQGPLEAGRTNCGRCEKCLRTMTELLVSDSLSASGPFATDEVDPSSIDRVHPLYWEELIDPLRRTGRPALAKRIEALHGLARKRESWFEERGWKGALRQLDRRFLGERLLQARRRLTRLAATESARR